MNKYFKILCIYLLNTNNISYTMEDMQNNIVSDNNYKVIQNNNDYIKYLEEENSKLAETVEQLSIKFDELQKLYLNQMQIDNAKKELNYLIKIKPDCIVEYMPISTFLYSSYIYTIKYMNKSWLQNNGFVSTYNNNNTYKKVYKYACDKVDTIKELLQKEKNGIIQKLIDDKKIDLDTNDKNKYYITSDSIPNLLYYNEKLSIYINDYCTQYLPKFKYLENYVSEVLKNANIIYKNNKNIKIKQSSKINKLELLLNDIKGLHNSIENINQSCDRIRSKLLKIQNVHEEFEEKLNYYTDGSKIGTINKKLNMVFNHIYDWRNEFNGLKKCLIKCCPININIDIDTDDLYKTLDTFEKEMKVEIQQIKKFGNATWKYEKLYKEYDELTQILKEIIDLNNC